MKIPSPFKHGDLSGFRAAVKRLKAEGLIPQNSHGKTVNVKTARPGEMFGGMTLRERVKAYKDVAEGNAVTIAKSRVSDTQGFKVAAKGLAGKERVIIPVNKDAKVYVEKKNIVIRHPGTTIDVKRTMLPRKDLRDYLTGIKKLPDLKGKEWYAAYVFHGKTKLTFQTGRQLADYLIRYEPMMRGASEKEKRDFFRTLEVVKIEGDAARREWIGERGSSRRTGKRKSEPYAKRRARFNKLPEVLKQRERARRAAYERKRRASKKGE